jgi:hypothetical protein
MAGKNKVTFEVRMDEKLYLKLAAAAAKENRTLNNHIAYLARTNVDYLERVHGPLDTKGIELPEE